MPKKKNPEILITPVEAAKMMGISDPETIRQGLRNGSFPIGFAYKGKRQWVYTIPRKPFETFMNTGKIPAAT